MSSDGLVFLVLQFHHAFVYCCVDVVLAYLLNTKYTTYYGSGPFRYLVLGSFLSRSMPSPRFYKCLSRPFQKVSMVFSVVVLSRMQASNDVQEFECLARRIFDLARACCLLFRIFTRRFWRVGGNLLADECRNPFGKKGSALARKPRAVKVKHATVCPAKLRAGACIIAQKFTKWGDNGK